MTALPSPRPRSSLALLSALALLVGRPANADTLDAATLEQARLFANQTAQQAASQVSAHAPPRPGAAAPRVEVIAGTLDPRLRLAPCERVEAYLPAGGAPRQTDLKSRQWFAAGDTVRVVASGAGFAITSDATALSHGLEGQTARVRTEGGRVLSGRPVGDRRIEVGL